MALYFIQDMRGRVKIGYTLSVPDRLKTLQAGNAEPLFVLRVMSGFFAAERWYQERFARNHVVREWFDFDLDMMTASAPEDIANILPPQWRGWKQEQLTSDDSCEYGGSTR